MGGGEAEGWGEVVWGGHHEGARLEAHQQGRLLDGVELLARGAPPRLENLEERIGKNLTSKHFPEKC